MQSRSSHHVKPYFTLVPTSHHFSLIWDDLHLSLTWAALRTHTLTPASFCWLLECSIITSKSVSLISSVRLGYSLYTILVFSWLLYYIWDDQMQMSLLSFLLLPLTWPSSHLWHLSFVHTLKKYCHSLTCLMSLMWRMMKTHVCTVSMNSHTQQLVLLA